MRRPCTRRYVGYYSAVRQCPRSRPPQRKLTIPNTRSACKGGSGVAAHTSSASLHLGISAEQQRRDFPPCAWTIRIGPEGKSCANYCVSWCAAYCGNDNSGAEAQAFPVRDLAHPSDLSGTLGPQLRLGFRSKNAARLNEAQAADSQPREGKCKIPIALCLHKACQGSLCRVGR